MFRRRTKQRPDQQVKLAPLLITYVTRKILEILVTSILSTKDAVLRNRLIKTLVHFLRVFFFGGFLRVTAQLQSLP